MKRSLHLVMLSVLLMGLFLVVADAWARAGGGSSSGSRGSRSYSAPVRPSSPSPMSPASPSQPAAPTSFNQPPQRSGWMGGLMGGIGGLLVGGLIGSMLFGGLGHGFGGGFGLIEILLVAALVYFGLSYMRRRQQGTLASPSGYAPAGYSTGGYPTGAEQPRWQPEPAARATAVVEAPAGPSDLDRGLSFISQMDRAFDPARFAETASDVFFRVQGAWTARDMAAVRDLLTPDMYATLQKDCDRLRAERRVNRLENIAVRSVAVTEAWQEGGQDFVTVGLLASLLDYTTDESGTQVLEGSRTEPVKFEEFWTFVRPVGPNAWKLSAIQQAQ